MLECESALRLEPGRFAALAGDKDGLSSPLACTRVDKDASPASGGGGGRRWRVDRTPTPKQTSSTAAAGGGGGNGNGGNGNGGGGAPPAAPGSGLRRLFVRDAVPCLSVVAWQGRVLAGSRIGKVFVWEPKPRIEMK